MATLRGNEAKIQQILKAAKKLFSENGYHATSLPSIAEEAKVSVGIIYYSFKSKEDILVELVSGIKKINLEIIENVNHVKDPLEQFKQIVTNLYKSMDKEYRLYLILYKDLSSVNKENREPIYEVEKRTSNGLSEVIRKGQQVGRFNKNVNADMFAFDVLGIGHLWALKKQWRFYKTMTIDDYIEEQLRIFQEALLSDRSFNDTTN